MVWFLQSFQLWVGFENPTLVRRTSIRWVADVGYEYPTYTATLALPREREQMTVSIRIAGRLKHFGLMQLTPSLVGEGWGEGTNP